MQAHTYTRSNIRSRIQLLDEAVCRQAAHRDSRAIVITSMRGDEKVSARRALRPETATTRARGTGLRHARASVIYLRARIKARNEEFSWAASERALLHNKPLHVLLCSLKMAKTRVFSLACAARGARFIRRRGIVSREIPFFSAREIRAREKTQAHPLVRACACG